MRQTVGIFLGTKFVVKYWHAKYENRKCCPQHEALNASSAGLAFSAVTIAVARRFYYRLLQIGSQVGDMFWHQDRILIVIAKPR
jgi:hypothetical protein